ncbi:hypothetical protein PsorP6_007994 [Peronosclerospora sorghi]|uniref:Uncharacterized protein n=1 Tax=Peronosclerospora sorghi TaxID=230839 RepID=A0ACC0WEB8_9STRA|nr:hypothetical protein PsorP6_007994 [Peronosclerospora sorghi]
MPEKLSAPFPANLPAPFPSEPPVPALRDNMLPPPEVEYASREQLEDAVQTFARGQGYGRE